MKEDVEIKQYKPDKKLYLLLLAGSAVFITASFLIPTNDRWFTIIAGLGCSGIASVIVAWLIDHVDCKHKEKANEELLEHLFERFDLLVQYEMNRLLEVCAKRDPDIDLDKQYTIQELTDIVKRADDKLVVWDKAYEEFGNAFSSVDAYVLTYDPTKQHNSIYSYLRMILANHESYKTMKERMDETSLRPLLHIFVSNDLHSIEKILEFRNKTVICEIKEDSKEYIRTFRRATKESAMKNQAN